VKFCKETNIGTIKTYSIVKTGSVHTSSLIQTNIEITIERVRPVARF